MKPNKSVLLLKYMLLGWILTEQHLRLQDDPLEGSLPGSFIHGIFQARVLEWGAIAFS